MELRFFGATGETTGSCHLIRSGRSAVLLDCGLHQGPRAESRRKNAHLPFSPASIDAVIQSHAHVDHSGKLPMLVRHGFRGAIHATPATRDLCEILLHDCAHILLQDAEYLNRQRMRVKLAASRKSPQRAHGSRRRARAVRDPREEGGATELVAEPVPQAQDFLPRPSARNDRLAHDTPRDLPRHELVPLYLDEDVDDTLHLFRTHAYGEWFEAAPGMRFRFHDAGHILGSSWIEAELTSGRKRERLVFTGDYGRAHQPILRDPAPLTAADVYIAESTYGDRSHPPIESLEIELAAIVRRLAERGRGRILIPAFAVGRTQNLLYALSRIYRDGRAPAVPIVVDSPLATAATQVYLRHADCFDPEAAAAYERHRADPAFRAHLRFTETVDESKALNRDPRPLIIVSASGMMESGRILHHLAWNVSSPDTEILIVGYQAASTLGRRLVDGAREVKIFGATYPVQARVTSLLGFSAHADRDELVGALAPFATHARALFLVHGEDDQRRPLARALRERGFARVEEPSGPAPYRL